MISVSSLMRIKYFSFWIIAIDKLGHCGYNNHADAVGSLLLLTRRPTFYFKEVSVLRVKEPNVKDENAIDDALEALARCLYPMMVTFFESDEGQREFAEWHSLQCTEELPGGVAESDDK